VCQEKVRACHPAIYIYTRRSTVAWVSQMAKPVYILIDEKLLREFDKARRKFGYNRSVAIREAMRQFVERVEKSRRRRP